MLNKIWNQKISGIPGAFVTILKISIDKTRTYFTTKLFVSNIRASGSNVMVNKCITYRYPECIEVQSNVTIGSNVTLQKEYRDIGSLKIKEGVSVGNNTSIDYTGGVIIDSYAHIAHNVTILTHDHGYNYMNDPIPKSLEIGANAFIGSNSVILHNCNYIGKYSIVGVGSVVTKDVPDYAIVAGNPARILKYITVE